MSGSESERPAEKHADPAPPVEALDSVRDRVRAQASPVRCPFCHDDVRVGEQRWVACAGCLARHHAGCWGEAGRCGACGDAASLAGGGGSRARGLTFLAIVGIALIVLVGVRMIVQSALADLRHDLQELSGPRRAATPARGPYLGESQAVAALRLAANGGDASAAYDLSRALAEGRDVVPDHGESYRLLEVAADLGDLRAMKSVARRLGIAHSDTAKQEKAAFWYRRVLAAEYDGESAAALACVLDREDPERKALLDRLANEGSGEAWIELGWLDRGREALLVAADRGDARARRQLYALEDSGRFLFGWDQDQGGLTSHSNVTEPRPAEAKALLTRWAAAGDAWAKAKLSRPGGGFMPFDDE